METYVPSKCVINSNGVHCVTSYGYRSYNLKSKWEFLDQPNNYDIDLFKQEHEPRSSLLRAVKFAHDLGPIRSRQIGDAP
jgi:hypothetical protein